MRTPSLGEPASSCRTEHKTHACLGLPRHLVVGGTAHTHWERTEGPSLTLALASGFPLWRELCQDWLGECEFKFITYSPLGLARCLVYVEEIVV